MTLLTLSCRRVHVYERCRTLEGLGDWTYSSIHRFGYSLYLPHPHR